VPSSTIARLIKQAADPVHTGPERAAALNAASRIAAEHNITIDLPNPPPGWMWRDGRLERIGPSGMIPPLKIGRRSWWGEPAEQPAADEEAADQPIEIASPPELPAALAAPTHRKTPKAGSTAATILSIIRRTGGASPAELMAETGASLGTIRASISIYARDEVVFDRGTGHYVRAVA